MHHSISPKVEKLLDRPFNRNPGIFEVNGAGETFMGKNNKPHTVPSPDGQQGVPC